MTAVYKFEFRAVGRYNEKDYAFDGSNSTKALTPHDARKQAINIATQKFRKEWPTLPKDLQLNVTIDFK